jgi:ABC-type nitrate/sulfonate/bicarbonate transport system substrate-binding protein
MRLRLGLLVALLVPLAACAPAAAPPPKPAASAAPAAGLSQQPAPAAQPADQPAAAPVAIRIGHGFAAEEQVWLMGARPDVTPSQGKAYTLQMTAFRGNNDRISAYEAGQLDGGTITAPTALFAAEKGMPLKLVASISREATGGQWHNTTYMALADSGIRSARDLRGKTIGIVDFKSAGELWARSALEAAGLDPDRDVSFVVIPFPAMGEALRTRKIDLGGLPQPFYIMEKNKGGVVEVFTSKTGVPFDEELSLVFLRPEFIQQHRAAVRAFLADYVAATRYYLEHTTDARQALLDKGFVQTPPEVYLTMQDWYREPTGRITVDGLAQLQELQLKVGWQAKRVDVGDLVDQSLLP